MKGHPPGPPPPDDLAAARQSARDADLLDAWLDANLARPGARTTPPGDDPPLAATARTTHDIAHGMTPTSDRDALWEDLMARYADPRPTAVTPSSGAERSLVPSLRQPVPALPGRGHPVAGRLMGMVATVTLVVLVSAAGLGVYLSRPSDPVPTPTSLAALGSTPASTTGTVGASPTPIRDDVVPLDESGTIWRLPEPAFYEGPLPELLGDAWHPLLYSNYLWVIEDTGVQAERFTYVDNSGNRVRTVVAFPQDTAQRAAVWKWAQGEVARYESGLTDGRDPLAEFPEYEEAFRVEGCDNIVRTVGLEPVTSFPVGATACDSSAAGIVVLVTVNGSAYVSGMAPQDFVADKILAAMLDDLTSDQESTPVP